MVNSSTERRSATFLKVLTQRQGNEQSIKPAGVGKPAKVTCMADDWAIEINPSDGTGGIMNVSSADHFSRAVAHIGLMANTNHAFGTCT